MKQKNNKAVFLDRDGILCELHYDKERGIVDSPLNPSQVKIIPGAKKALQSLRDAGYLIIIASNQPIIAKKKASPSLFEKICASFMRKLSFSPDAVFYCLHHPESKVASLKKECDCRKPKPGLLLKAALELNIDLKKSWMVGDNLTDTQAGNAAGCQTILVQKSFKLENQNYITRENKPSFTARDLGHAARIIIFGR